MKVFKKVLKLIHNVVGQVIENDRTRLPMSLFKKFCSIIGILHNRVVSSEIFMDVVSAVEHIRNLNLSDRKEGV